MSTSDKPGTHPTGDISDTIDEVKDEISQVSDAGADAAKGIAESRFEQGREVTTEQLDNASDAINEVAEKLEENDSPFASYASELSEQLSSFSTRLSTSSIDDLVGGARSLARDNPAAFMLGSMAIGLAASRFFKGSRLLDTVITRLGRMHGLNIDTTDRQVRSAQGAMREPDDIRNVGSLLLQLGHDVGSLVTTEVNLAKAEIGESLDDAMRGVISLVTASVILFAGLIILLNGLTRTLAAVADMQAWVSFLIVGGVVSIIGGVLLANGKSRLSADNLSLNRTEASLRKDQKVATEQLP